MSIIFQKHIRREDLQKNRDCLFVFGDNYERVGLGGQAKEMRGEPNAIGLTTKKKPTYGNDAFLYDNDLIITILLNTQDIQTLISKLKNNGTVIWPLDGIGTGRANLINTSPKLYYFYKELLLYLETI